MHCNMYGSSVGLLIFKICKRFCECIWLKIFTELREWGNWLKQFPNISILQVRSKAIPNVLC